MYAKHGELASAAGAALQHAACDSEPRPTGIDNFNERWPPQHVAFGQLWHFSPASCQRTTARCTALLSYHYSVTTIAHADRTALLSAQMADACSCRWHASCFMRDMGHVLRGAACRALVSVGILFAWLMLVLWPLEVAALPDARTASPADRAAAQALFDEGRQMMTEGRPADACPRFEESQRLDSGLGTQYHLADCYESLGKLASAHTLFLEVAAQAEALGQKRREQLARQRAEAVQPRLPKLSIEVPPASVAQMLLIERDGSPVGRAQWGLAVPVDPGMHRVRASAPGYVSWEAQVDVSNDPAVRRLSVPPLQPRASFLTPTSRKVGLGALGVGVAALGLGSVFAVQAHSKNQDSYRAGCNDNGCPTPGSRKLRQAAIDAGNRATWAVGAGAVSLTAAAVLFWVVPGEEGDTTGESVSLQPVVDLSGRSLQLKGAF